jgi:hypothetical protein
MFKWIKRLVLSLIVGLKKAETDSLAQKATSLSDNDGFHETIQSRRLSDALRRGEVTQEVEEMRYRDYTVANESKKYKYIGDGEAIKKDETIVDYNNFSFGQDNNIICNGVLDEISRVGSATMDSYVLNIVYGSITRFKLEKYCKFIDVNIIDGTAHISLYFSSFFDKYDISSKAFINELNFINENKEYCKHNHELCDSIVRLGFVTYKAYGEDDLVKYDFYDLKCLDITANQHEYILTYSANHYHRENLIEKFYSKTMAQKYEKKESKYLEYNMYDEQRIEKCDKCGNEMSVYDADITRATFGESLCVSCLENKLEKECIGLDF